MSRAEEDTDWLPATSGGRRERHLGRRILVTLLVLLLVPVVYAGALALHADNSVERVAVDGLSPHLGGPLNTVVIGSDSRAELSDEQRRELTTGGDFGPERTDTIFVLSVEGGRAAMLSFPRDLWVERCDGREQRINTAVQAGGLSCLARTIEDVSGIPIHHAVTVSFLGFVDVVDAVGGVEICLTSPIQDRDAGIDLPEGCQVLGGTDALGYVRVRKIDNDLKRIERQQGFLKALAQEIAKPSTLLNPIRLWQTVGEVGGAVTADDGLGTLDMARLGLGARGIATGNVVAQTVPTRSGRAGSAAVEFVTDEAADVFAAFRDGSILGRAAEAGDGPTVARSDVSVEVLNGSRIEGAAGETAETLRTVGYEVTSVGNAAETAATTIVHPIGDEAAAELLASDVEQALGRRPVLEPRDDVSRVILILGRDLAP